jgi:hypothetical protein
MVRNANPKGAGMRRLAMAMAMAMVIVLVALAQMVRADSMHDTAAKLYSSLSPQQRDEAVLSFDSPERNKEVFTPGKRAGVQIKNLSEAQRKMAIDLITAFTSEYGRGKAEAIANQEPTDKGFGHYYFCFFGDPTKDENYAWRVAEHHLTLVQVEVEKGKPVIVGPILLGANPPNLFDEEEDSMIAIYGSMKAEERAKAALKEISDSASPMPAGAGIRVGDLNPVARDEVKVMMDLRLKFFSEDVRKRIQSLIDANGGLDEMKLAFYGEATQRCAQGGKWDMKIAGPGFLCDYENTRGHIHMSLKANAG